MSIKIDNVSIADLGFKITSFSELDITGKTKDYTLEIANKNGLIDMGARLSPKVFNFQCFFIGNETISDIFLATKTLVAALFDENGFPQNVELEFTGDPGVFFTVRYSGTISMLKQGIVGDFSLPLICYDVFSHGVLQTINTDIGTTEALVKTTKYRLSPTITVTALSAMENITITINSLGDTELGTQILSHTGTLSISDVLIFDLANYQTTLNGSIINSLIDGVFPKVGIGTNNITVNASSGTANVKIEWKEKYLW